jgi:hypothetical protein
VNPGIAWNPAVRPEGCDTPWQTSARPEIPRSRPRSPRDRQTVWQCVDDDHRDLPTIWTVSWGSSASRERAPARTASTAGNRVSSTSRCAINGVVYETGPLWRCVPARRHAEAPSREATDSLRRGAARNGEAPRAAGRTLHRRRVPLLRRHTSTAGRAAPRAAGDRATQGGVRRPGRHPLCRCRDAISFRPSRNSAGPATSGTRWDGADLLNPRAAGRPDAFAVVTELSLHSWRSTCTE